MVSKHVHKHTRTTLVTFMLEPSQNLDVSAENVRSRQVDGSMGERSTRTSLIPWARGLATIPLFALSYYTGCKPGRFYCVDVSSAKYCIWLQGVRSTVVFYDPVPFAILRFLKK